MATQTRHSVAVEQPEVDVFSSLVIDRLPNPPVITMHFTPAVKVMEADGVTQTTNTTGHPLHRGVLAGYSVSIVADTMPALMRLAGIMGGVENRIASAAETLDDALTSEAEGLRDAMLAWWDAEADPTLEAMEAHFGVKVNGNHPFTS